MRGGSAVRTSPLGARRRESAKERPRPEEQTSCEAGGEAEKALELVAQVEVGPRGVLGGVAVEPAAAQHDVPAVREKSEQCRV